jgi:hypothetical protein
VIGVHTVPGGEDARHAAAHLPVHRDGAPDAERHPGGFGENGVGANTDDDENQVDGADEPVGGVAGGVTGDRQPAACLLDAGDCGAGVHVDVVAGQLVGDQRGQGRVDGGEHLSQLLHDGDVQATGGKGFGHLQAEVAGADDERRCGPAVQVRGEGERVAHGVQQVHPVGGAEPVEAGDGWADRYRTGADDQPVVGQVVDAPIRPSHGHHPRDRVDPLGVGVQTKL